MKLSFEAGLSFHRDLHLMVWQPRGILDEAHVEELIAVLEEAEDEAHIPFHRYTDLSKVDAMDLSDDYIFRVSLYRRVLYGERSRVKSAFYVTDRPTARVALTHAAVMRDSPVLVKVFMRARAAAKWLEVRLEDLELAR